MPLLPQGTNLVFSNFVLNTGMINVVPYRPSGPLRYATLDTLDHCLVFKTLDTSSGAKRSGEHPPSFEVLLGLRPPTGAEDRVIAISKEMLNV